MNLFFEVLITLVIVSNISGIMRKDVIKRAQFWSSKGISYSMSNYHPDPEGKSYRTDCSGYVSMAWKLQKSYSTVTLPEVSRRIDKSELMSGDIVMKGGPGSGGANGHVVIFEKWADTAKTKYHAYEQTPPKTIYHVIPYPYKNGGAGFVPYRYKNIEEDNDGGGGSCTCCHGKALGEYCGHQLCGSGCVGGNIYGCNKKNGTPSREYGRCAKGCTASGDGKSYCNK